MKIFAVGWNYLNHNKEMNRALLPKEPVLFMKPDTALLKDGKPFSCRLFRNGSNTKPSLLCVSLDWEKISLRVLHIVITMR